MTKRIKLSMGPRQAHVVIAALSLYWSTPLGGDISEGRAWTQEVAEDLQRKLGDAIRKAGMLAEVEKYDSEATT